MYQLFRSIHYRQITILIFILLISISCKSKLNTIDIASVDVKIDNTWINAMTVIQNPNTIKELITADTILAGIISTAVLGSNPGINDSLLLSYINDPDRKKLHDTTELIFSHFDWQTLKIPLGRYQASFPDKTIPVFYPVISDFNYGLFQFKNQKGEEAIGVGKEMFAGLTGIYDQLSIANPNFSSYINRTFNLIHLPEKIMTALASDVVEEPRSNRLLDHILVEGKKLYLVRQWMPDLTDSIWFECTQEQINWIKDNELDIWRFLLTDKLLYKNSNKDIANLTKPAPHSQGMPPEAPGRAVNYIGYKIIESYAKNNKVSLPELANEHDYDQILQKAKYKPR